MELKEILKASQARNKARLAELQDKVEKGEVRSEELAAVKAEVEALTKEAQTLADEIAKLEAGEKEEDQDKKKEEDPDKKEDPDAKTELSEEQRSEIMTAIGTGLSTKGHTSTKNKEMETRSAFANYIVGNIDEKEARALGLVTGNGSVTIPDFLSKEIITYAQEENFLRRLGTGVKTKENIKYPVLVKKAEAQGHKNERTNNEIPETDIEFDEIELSPTEFDALATVTKKLLARTGLPIEQIVMDELKKAYVRKETQYMVNGDEANNINDGALAKKAAEFKTDEKNLYDALVKMKNTPVKEVRKKARWVLNTAALTKIETMKTDDGFPLLRPFNQAEGGIGYTLLGFPVEEEDAIDIPDSPDTPVFYFGDFSKFYIQDVIGSLEVQKLVELFSRTNRVGFRIWNLLDAQLIHSPFEVPVYKYVLQDGTPTKP
ncbi:phage major capsid protein [Bacillus cereus]|uniref:HK97 family phage major capsid protein n=2 Tax=Bacillus cereus group TaxID=86661 RepID=A0A9W5P2I8_BACCE|nr:MULTISPECIES: phage major capsid protein [Bacillus cereus group]MEB8731222.1 phage major capsid protein [Bacillus cereus]EEM44080.1 Phage major capsid protein, HK97 [Bacillus thuringiensis serovar pakistani str. T13001]EJR71983.1 HK97 family phage major capsid protein [Bacillus cereus VD154]KIU70654.1 Phage prohead protease [Bacillus thuringiensis Sbt003]MEB8749119.1 phage major capsid protein [Bacillus cereus]